MSGHARASVLLAALIATLASSTAWAQTCTFKPQFPSFISVVAQTAGIADPTGAFNVRIQDFDFQPIVNVPVEIDFSACPDFRLCTIQPDPAATVTCGGGVLKVTKLTDINGVASFTIVGCARNSGASPGCGANAVVIRACGQVLGNATACSYDQDGGGLGANDLSAFLGDLFSGGYFARSDYDGNGVLSANDMSLWVTRFLSGQSLAGCNGTNPPGVACP